MKVLVVGAGVGGLATALSLSDAGFGADVQLVEAAPQILPLGVGINLLPQGVRELQELGFSEDLERWGVRARSITYFDRFGGIIANRPKGLEAGYDWPAYFFHRGVLQNMLLGAVRQQFAQDAIRTGTRLVGVETVGEVAHATLLDVESGSTEIYRADLVVAADGVNSTARALLHPGEGQPRWNGNVMYRGTTALDAPFLDGGTHVYGGHFEQRFLAYPIRTPDGEVVLNWGATVKAGDAAVAPEDWNRQIDRNRVQDLYEGWNVAGCDIQRIISDAQAVYEYPQVDRDPLDHWTVGRVTLLGDAAHPMQPTGSNGTSQAILDARVLARELALHRSIDEALASYDAQRVAQTGRIVLANRSMADARILQLVHERAPEGFDDIDDVISSDEITEVIRSYQQLAGFDPEDLRSRPSLSVMANT